MDENYVDPVVLWDKNEIFLDVIRFAVMNGDEHYFMLKFHELGAESTHKNGDIPAGEENQDQLS